MMDNFWLFQIMFDIGVVGYILFSRYIEKKEKESLLRLVESLRNLVEKQKKLIEIANVRISEHQERLGRIFDDIQKKNTLLTQLLSTINAKTLGKDVKEQIIMLSRSGKSTDEIAKQLKMNKGEVELIIKLYEEDT